jgi:hypothetical protein
MLVTSTKNNLQEFLLCTVFFILSRLAGDAPPANGASKRLTEAEFSVPGGPVRKNFSIVDYIPLSWSKNLASDSALFYVSALHGAY